MDKTSSASHSITVPLGSHTIAAKAWGDPKAPPILALHGWLDNCASFDFVAPLLADHYVVCMDCPGHGRSFHNAQHEGYSLWRDVAILFRVADHFGWQEFSLLGHSRGAITAFMAAGTFPSRIVNLMLLEGIVPQPTDFSSAPQRLARSITESYAALIRPTHYYQSFEQAVTARVKGIFPISLDDAKVLANHGVQKSEHGYYWEYDPKLMAQSDVGVSLDQAEAFYRNITARVILLKSEHGFVVAEPRLVQWLETHSKIQSELFPGDHHFHMHAQSSRIGVFLTKWLNEKTN